MDTTLSPLTETGETLARDGYAFVPAGQMRTVLTRVGPLSDWASLRCELERPRPRHLHGRRRPLSAAPAAAFGAAAGEPIERKPHQPHYQSRNYNPLNGGVARWFDPVLPEIADGAHDGDPATCHALFERPGADAGLACRGAPVPHRGAQPASRAARRPEGMHRDGVD